MDVKQSRRILYCETLDEAIQEVARRRAAKTHGDGVITKYESSPYGGYRVYSIEVDALVDELLEPVTPSLRRDFRFYRDGFATLDRTGPDDPEFATST